VAYLWHRHGVPRVRVSTTVDGDLLARARGIRAGATDAALLDEALRALLLRHRSAEIDAAYSAYDEHPINEPDAWGDLASFSEVSIAVLVERLGALSGERMRELCDALEVAVDCP
jgi:hypothetical protein